MNQSNTIKFFALIVCLILTHPVEAFKLFPNATETERKIANLNSSWSNKFWQSAVHEGIQHFSEAVHEEITNRIYWCSEDCDNDDYADVPELFYITAGIRWNDDPPFSLSTTIFEDCPVTPKVIRLVTAPECWKKLFDEAERKAKEGKYDAENSHDNLMQRSHFGDLQFIHAMASKDGEKASETKRKMMIWAEFTWRVATREYNLGTFLKNVKIEGFEKFFGKTEWRVQDLFTLGNPMLRRGVDQVAFGSLLHMVQDSFSEAHTLRKDGIKGDICSNGSPKPGMIELFYSYQNQDHKEHKKRDSRNALESHMIKYDPDVVDIGKKIVSYMEDMSPPASWEKVAPYFECIFDIENPDANAIAGYGLEKNK